MLYLSFIFQTIPHPLPIDCVQSVGKFIAFSSSPSPFLFPIDSSQFLNAIFTHRDTHTRSTCLYQDVKHLDVGAESLLVDEIQQIYKSLLTLWNFQCLPLVLLSHSTAEINVCF